MKVLTPTMTVAFVLGFATAAHAQYIPPPNIYAPSTYGTPAIVYSPPMIQQQSLGSMIREREEIGRAFGGGARPCVPAAGDRC